MLRASYLPLYLSDALLAQDVVLGHSLGREDRILAELVVQGRKLVDFVDTDFAVEHAERVVRILLPSGRQLLVSAHLGRCFFKTIVCYIIAMFGRLLQFMCLVRNEILQFTLLELRRGVSSVGSLHLLAGAHVQETFVELADFVCGEIHIFAVLQDLIE